MLWRAPSKRRESESRVCYRLRAKTHRKGNAARAVTRFVHFVRPSRVGRAPRPTHALFYSRSHGRRHDLQAALRSPNVVGRRLPPRPPLRRRVVQRLTQCHVVGKRINSCRRSSSSSFALIICLHHLPSRFTRAAVCRHVARRPRRPDPPAGRRVHLHHRALAAQPRRRE